MPDIPPPTVLRDVFLGHLLPGSGKRKIFFDAYPPDSPFPQLKHDGELRDTAFITEMSADDRERATDFQEVAIYAGPYLRHFGHFVAECIHRLYAKTWLPHLRGAKVVFLEGPRHVLEPWVPDVLRLCGVDMADVVFLGSPTRFRELHVPVQGRVIAGKTLLPRYVDLFPLGEIGAQPGGRRLYVSKSRHLFSGSYLGERLVETTLAEVGFDIVYPEDLAPSLFVSMIRGASICLFAEGSAVHNLELCGRVDAKVGVVSRRRGAAHRFGDILDVASESRVFDYVISDGFPLDWDISQGTPSWPRACALVDIAALLNAISAFIGVPLQVPSAERLREGVLADVARYVLDIRTTRKHTTDEQLGALLTQMRKIWAKHGNKLER